VTGYVLSPRARADLDAIWDYSVAHWGSDRTELYIRELQRAIEYLSADPRRRGRQCDEIRTGYFKHSVGSHVLFYRLTGDGIDVVRILHSRMDFGRHL
jgi:toxin ParE1/3/4